MCGTNSRLHKHQLLLLISGLWPEDLVPFASAVGFLVPAASLVLSISTWVPGLSQQSRDQHPASPCPTYLHANLLPAAYLLHLARLTAPYAEAGRDSQASLA